MKIILIRIIKLKACLVNKEMKMKIKNLKKTLIYKWIKLIKIKVKKILNKKRR